MVKQMYYTKHLVLCLSNAKMAQKVIEYLENNKDFLSETEPTRTDIFYTEDYQRAELERDEKAFSDMLGVKFWILHKNEDRIIGMVAFSGIIMGAFKSCFLSYRLDRKEVNKGLMTEAVEKGIEIAFNHIGLHRIEANIMPKNKASLRVVEKLHFQNEGLSRKYLKINGVWEDHIHMVLLNENDLV